MAKIQNLLKDPTLNSEDAKFLEDFQKKVQELNNELPKFKQLCEKTMKCGTEAERNDVANNILSAGKMFHELV